MRRALVFLILFGIGLTLLLLLRGERREREADEVLPVPGPGEFTQVPLGPGAPEGQQVSVLLDGPLSLTVRGGSGPVQRPEIELRAEDVDSLGGDQYDLNGLEVQVLEPDTGVLRASMSSPRTRVSLDLAGQDVGRASVREARFEQARVVLHEGAPVVPLTLTAPSIDWNVQELGFTSSARVVATGRGFAAEGTGLRAGFGEARLVLERDAFVDLQLERGLRAHLRSGPEGELVVARAERDGVQYVDVMARGGARLEIEDEQRFSLAAATVHLVGRLPRAEGEVYELVSADAQGDVIAKSGADELRAQTADFAFAAGGRPQLATFDRDVQLNVRTGRFTAQSAVFDFDASGALSKATLSGAPEGEVRLGEHLAGRRPDLADALARIRGAGPLVLERADGANLDLAGPATVLVEEVGLRLDAEERVTARVAETQQRGELHATGAVVLTHLGNELRGPAVDLFWRLDEQGGLVVDAAAPGDTRLTGTTVDGDRVTLHARGGLETRWSAGRIDVPAAQEVALDVAGPRPLRARARQISNLDWLARSFVAEGDVEFSSSDGWGRAQRAVVRGERDIELVGAEGELAVYSFARAAEAGAGAFDARIDARSIRATERAARARGDVRVQGGNAQGSLDLRAQSVDVDVAPEIPGSAAPRPFRVRAETGVAADVTRLGERARIEADWLQIDGRLEAPAPGTSTPSAVPTSTEARGNVHLVLTGEANLDATADRFVIDESRRGRLSAGAGRRVEALGSLPGALTPFRMTADWIDFAPDSLRASRIEARVEPGLAQDPRRSLVRELRALSLSADPEGLLLEGEARVAGLTGQGEDWSLEAQRIRLVGDFSDPAALDGKDVRSLSAQGGFVAQLGTRGTARGDTLEGDPDQIRIEGRPAELAFLDVEWRATSIRYDATNMLLATGPGEVTSRAAAPGPSWSLEYESMQPFDQGDTTILALRNPRFRLGSQQLFSDWALFWIDRERWRASGRSAISRNAGADGLRVTDPRAAERQEPGEQQTVGPLSPWAGQLRKSAFFGLLSEVYLEGNMEIYEVGERRARAAALYLELIDGHGWIQDADVQAVLNIGGQPRRIRAKADWMRLSSDGSLRADTAVLSACEHDEPHYVVETSDLRLTPELNPKDDRVAYKVSAEGNAIRFGDAFAVPLPPLVYETDEEGKPLIDRFVLGSSAQFGTAIGASINAQLGGIGMAVGRFTRFALAMPEVPIRGGWNFDVRWLGSRGLLLGTGLELRIGDEFKLEADFDVIPDKSSDSGLIRVDADDRSLLRTWFHSRGRYVIDRGDDGQWVDLALSIQSDPAVQSEFFERDFLYYEQKDNYLHWRRVKDNDYASATLKVVIEDRTDVNELPSVGLFRGRTDVGEAFGRTLYHTGTFDVAYLRREEGDPRYYDPYPDGLGEREVLRADTIQRLELPFPVGWAALQATPYVEARGTVWSEGVDEQDTPAEAALFAGIEASTTFFRRSSSGNMHTLTPSVTVRGDVADVSGGGEPVRFDGTEDPMLGRFAELGLRARWWKPEAPDSLDAEIRTGYGVDVEGPVDDGVQPFATLLEYRALLGGFPFAFSFDSRYDLENGDTLYSRTLMGFEPVHDLGFEFGHHFGRDVDGDVLYEAASGGARWRWTSKWEIEATQTLSLFDGRSLATEGLLRRLGHDFVLELELGYRAGQGSRFGIGFQPRLSWKRRSLGLIDSWLGVYH